MTTAQAIVIDPEARTITQIRVPGDFMGRTKAVREIVAPGHPELAINFDRDQLYVSSEGMLARPPLGGFAWDGFPPMIGPAVLTGMGDGEEDALVTDPSQSVEDVTRAVTWKTAKQAWQELQALYEAEKRRLEQDGVRALVVTPRDMDNSFDGWEE